MQELNKIRCFISSSPEDVDKAVKISEFLEKEGIDTITWQNSFFPGLTLVENLRNAVSKADFVVLLLPSNYNEIQTEQNDANPLFEMGLIVGMGKPLLTLVKKNSYVQLPSDLASIMYLQYEPQKVESSFRNIKNWVLHSSVATAI